MFVSGVELPSIKLKRPLVTVTRLPGSVLRSSVQIAVVVAAVAEVKSQNFIWYMPSGTAMLTVSVSLP